MSALESSPNILTCSIVPNREEVAVVAEGELDLASATDVQRAVAELVATGFRRIVLDLHGVSFIDSSGLRMLLSLRDAAERNGHTLTLVAPTAVACRIFDLTGTRAMFEWRSHFTA